MGSDPVSPNGDNMAGQSNGSISKDSKVSIGLAILLSGIAFAMYRQIEILNVKADRWDKSSDQYVTRELLQLELRGVRDQIESLKTLVVQSDRLTQIQSRLDRFLETQPAADDQR